MRTELKRPYPAIRTGASLSCGGSQNWFPDENFRLCGCGVIACADVLLYLTGQTELTREEYFAHVAALRKYFPLIPRRGIDGVRLAVGFNLCARRMGVNARAGWSASGAKFWMRLERQLKNDLPAIISIGPNFPRVWGNERLPLYRKTEDGFAEAGRTKGHFLTVIALDDEWMEVSSWGQQLYLKRSSYTDYMRRQGALLTNLLFLERKTSEA